MKERLDNLGIHMPLKPLPMLPEEAVIDQKGRFVNPATNNSGTTEYSPEDTSQSELRSSMRVRARLPTTNRASSSADAMPPPPKPLSRVMSLRKVIPDKIRETFSPKSSTKGRNQVYMHSNSPALKEPLGVAQAAEESAHPLDSYASDMLGRDMGFFTPIGDPRKSRSALSQAPVNDEGGLLGNHPHPLRSHPPNAFATEPSRAADPGPATPTAVAPQRPTDVRPRVVSSHFRQANHNSTPTTRRTHTERRNSYGQSATCQSPGSRSRTRVCDWDEQPSLNGLSFFSSPVNEKNEPINWKQQAGIPLYTTPPHNPRLPNLDSRGFIIKPSIGRAQRHLSAYTPYPHAYIYLRLPCRFLVFKSPSSF